MKRFNINVILYLLRLIPLLLCMHSINCPWPIHRHKDNAIINNIILCNTDKRGGDDETIRNSKLLRYL